MASTRDALTLKLIGDVVGEERESRAPTEEERLHTASQHQMCSVLVQLLVKELDDQYFYKAISTACTVRGYRMAPMRSNEPGYPSAPEMVEACDMAYKALERIESGEEVDTRLLKAKLGGIAYHAAGVSSGAL